MLPPIFTHTWDLTPLDYSHLNNRENLFRVFYMGEDIGGCVTNNSNNRIIGTFTLIQELDFNEYILEVSEDKIYILPPQK